MFFPLYLLFAQHYFFQQFIIVRRWINAQNVHVNNEVYRCPPQLTREFEETRGWGSGAGGRKQVVQECLDRTKTIPKEERGMEEKCETGNERKNKAFLNRSSGYGFKEF